MKLKGLFIFTFLFIVMLFCSCSSKKEPINIIKAPDKIIIYKDNKPYTIEKDHKDFNKIVQLTNQRIILRDFDECLDIVSDSSVDSLKEHPLSVEFIYNKKQSFTINKDSSQNFDYYKLFFLLVDKDFGTEQGSDIYIFQYGNATSYINSSKGDLKTPKDLIKLINSMNLK